MKNLYILLSFFLLIIFSSCENKEKYYGEWMMILHEPTNQAEKIIITKDSIFIGAYPFHKFYSESLKLKGNKLELFKKNFKLKIENDSLLHFNNSTYIKKGYPFYDNIIYDPEKLITIEYPNIENAENIDRKGYPQIYFGKKINSNKHSLQLNDRIADLKDLREFLLPNHHRYYGLALTADKNAKMKDINEIFYHSKSIDVRKVKLINNIDYYYEDNDMILTSEEGIYIFLNRFKEEETIVRSRSSKPPPPPPLNYSLKNILEGSEGTVISLIKNEFHYGLKKSSKEELYKLILNNFKNNYFVIIYDDESTYIKYLELMNIYNTTFSEIKNIKANKKFNKPFNSLSKQEKNEISISTPKYILTGISFEDFKSLNIKIPELELMN